MKILATSDMHGNLDGLNFTGIDLVVFAGDIAKLTGRGPWQIYDQVKWMNTKFAKMCTSWPSTTFVFVPGNHDFFPIAKERFSNKLLGKDLKLVLPKNAHMLLDSETTIKKNDQSIRIYGTPWVPIISHSWAFEAEHDKLKEKFSHIPIGLDILVTHAPPHIDSSTFIDRSLQWGMSRAFGSTELADEILVKQPKFVFCGHIHSGDHSPKVFGKSTIYNVSRVDERYEIAYNPLTFSL